MAREAVDVCYDLPYGDLEASERRGEGRSVGGPLWISAVERYNLDAVEVMGGAKRCTEGGWGGAWEESGRAEEVGREDHCMSYSQSSHPVRLWL